MARLAEPRYGLARVLSKRGLCSRAQAEEWIRQARVRVNGKLVRDPEFPVAPVRDIVELDGYEVSVSVPVHVMLNKPRGLVTTARDERGRDTVYRCFEGASLNGAPLPWMAPVGRLDKASEGLLLFSNDTSWAARICDPETGPEKTYRVQVDLIPDEALLKALCVGLMVDGEHLRVVSASLLQKGQKNAWVEIVLDEGRNRHIRRLLQAFGVNVLRLVRTAIGGLALGDLPKGQWRQLNMDDLHKLG